MLREGFENDGEYIAAVVADRLTSRRSSDEDDGKRHPRLVLQQVVRFNLWPRKFMRAGQPQKMLNVAEKRVSIAAHGNL